MTAKRVGILIFPAVEVLGPRGRTGASAGIDMALRVVARSFGEAIGRSTAHHMEYPFPDDNRRRV
jgi:hypothetical protein